MSIRQMTRVWDESPYDGKMLLIHLALADNADDSGEAWPSQATVARKARSSVEWVRRAMAKMVDDGRLRQLSESQGRGKPAHWLLVWEPPTELGLVSETPNPPTPKPPTDTPENPQLGPAPSLDELLEPLHEPAPDGAVALSSASATRILATEILREAWEAQDPRPQQPYQAAVAVIRKALNDGWSDVDLRRFLSDEGFPVSGARLDIWRNRRKPRHPSARQIPSRDGYGPEGVHRL